MTDLPHPLPAVLAFLSTNEPTITGRPEQLHVHPDAYAALSTVHLRNLCDAGIGGFDHDGRTMYGLQLRSDPRLPERQWRITGRDGTLIHDSRSGKKPPQWD